MPWVPKAGTPVSFDLGEQLAALVTGDPDWGWLLAWAPSLGVADNVTADFCAQGPPDFSFDATVLLPVAGRTPMQTAINLLARLQSIRHLAEQRVFAAYCEFSHGAGLSCTLATTISKDEHVGGNRTLVDFTPLPAGTTHIRYHPTSSDTGHVPIATYVYSDSAYLGQISDANPVVGADGDVAQTISGATRFAANYDNNGAHTFTVQISTCVTVAAGTDDYTPDEPVPPVGYVPPPAKTYDSIADLGRELDAQEFKLDLLSSHVRFLAAQLVVPGTDEVTTPIDVEPDTPVEVNDAAGCIVTLAGIPSWADEDFGTPRRVFRIGRIDFGNAAAWSSSVEITHSPFLVQPLPIGTTRVQVNTHPAVSATLTLLKKPK